MTRLSTPAVSTALCPDHTRAAEELYLRAQATLSPRKKTYLTEVLTRFLPGWQEYLETRLTEVEVGSGRHHAIERAYCRERLGYIRMYRQASGYRVVNSQTAREVCAASDPAELPRLLVQRKLVRFYRSVLEGVETLDTSRDLFELLMLHDLYDSVQDGRAYTHQSQKKFLDALAKLLPAAGTRPVVFCEENKARTQEIFRTVQDEVALSRLEYLDFWRTGHYRHYPEARIQAVVYLQLFCPLEYNLTWVLRDEPVLRTRIERYNPALSAPDAPAIWRRFVQIYERHPGLPTPPPLPVCGLDAGLAHLRRRLRE